MKIKLMSLLAMTVIALLVFAGITFATEPDTPGEPSARAKSVRITVGDQTIMGVAEGDVVHRGERSSSQGADGTCSVPGVTIRMSGDVRKVKVGLAEGTCNLIVKDLVFNDTVISPGRNGPPGSAFNTQAGWEWYVESLAKVVGIKSIDDLTKTSAWFDFKMANFTGGGPVYDGHDGSGECWAANFPQPPFYYYVDSCVLSSTDLEGSMEMHVEVEAEYYNTKKSHFDHDVTSRAIAKGYHYMPHVFDQECSETGVPYDWQADFECELYWELVGYSND